MNSTPSEIAVKRNHTHIDLAAALAPIVSRVRTSTCCVKRPGKHPERIDQPLTADRLANHVNGGPAYGVYPMQPGSDVTRVGLLDLDSHKGETPWHEMQDTAVRIVTAASAAGMLGIPFRSSGGAGIHIYFLWDTPQDAYSVRQALQRVLAACDLQDGTKGVAAGQVECFPKQSSVPHDGYGNMFVLPLAGKSVPLDSFELDDMPKSYVTEMDWPISAPVPRVEREVVVPSAAVTPADLGVLKSALDAVPNSGEHELDYDSWRNVLFGVHHASQGSDDGLALVHEFSARSSKYDPAKTDRDWGYAGKNQGTPITIGTIKAMAAAHGWKDPAREPSEEDFDVVPADGQQPPRPGYRRNGKGEILALAENIVTAVRAPHECGWHIRYDDFRAEIMLAAEADPRGLRAFTDPDYTRLQIRLERLGFLKLSKEGLRDGVALVADENHIDSAVEWLTRLQHDGVPRIETFLRDYMAVEDTPYTRAVSRYLWTALAGRVLSPGCEAPMVPVLIGEQGAGKTRAVKALVPAQEFYCELKLDERDDNASRMMRGRLVVELGELRGLHTRDAESIKAFISRTHENFVPKYREFSVTFARRFLFIGTTNQDEFLADETGERRWLPVRVGRCDVDRIAADCLQLWAEARATYERAGNVDWREAETLAREVHAQHKLSDPWAPIIHDWLMGRGDYDCDLGEPPCTRDFLQIHDIADGALGIAKSRLGRSDMMRISKILQGMGYSKRLKRVGGHPTKVWMRSDVTTVTT
ncbi:VapE domain-containing protein [Burkholderia multivorans]|uniref:VapE domain-containing protein n=1 Tax=Burkholderia multivorans TaxID=87883 RepID=UPI001C221589|nr:VapE domain-containing protein [Burkholderia multivorans]MBU9221058.1 PriCT-2 domain-containing protein [Burkholderia multivorans]MBU9415862.1 PriCT-2 domain-containing protein [Burkholderia multivorans]